MKPAPRPAVIAVVGTFAALGVLTGVGQAQDWDKVEIKATHVGGTVYVLEGAGGNIGVSVGADGILMVDDQFAAVADKVRTAMQELHRGDVEFILNTHWHGDHTNANTVFGEEAHIISHHNVRARLRSDQNLSRGDYPALAESGWPVLTFEESVSIHFNGEEIRVVHYPESHTDGDAAIFFSGSNVVHLGDLHFSGLFPFVDLETGGTVEGVIASLESILTEVSADTRFISGHGGPVNTADDLRRDVTMIQETAKIAQEWHERGLSLDQAKAEGLPDEFESYSWNFIPTERWIETLFHNYAR